MTPVGIIGFILFDTWCKSPPLYFRFFKNFRKFSKITPQKFQFEIQKGSILGVKILDFWKRVIFVYFGSWFLVQKFSKILDQYPKTIFSVYNMLYTENAAWGLMKWGVKWIEFWGHWFIESKHFWTTVDTPITGIIQFPFYMFLRVKFKLIHQFDP